MSASAEAPTTIENLLPLEMLESFRARASRFDAENEFFHEDLAALRATGYLAAPVPVELGGAGLSLEQLVAAQRRLASFAPATALGVNMHLVWVQVARFLRDRAGGGGAGGHGEGSNGGTSAAGPLDWVMRDAVAGEIFAFGISEAGNEAVLMDSFSRAEPQADGGYLVSGTKIFTTLSPVWTRLGVHARVDGVLSGSPKLESAAEAASGTETETEAAPAPEPRLVFGFVRRDGAENSNLEVGSIAHPGQWNPLGMRATQSYTTELDGVRIAPDDIAATIAPFDGSDPLVLGIFSSFSILTASVYAGIGDRAVELAAEAANRVVPQRGGGEAPRLSDPDVASRLTAAVLEHRTSLDTLQLLARDIDDARNRSDWFLALAAARNRVTDEARSSIDTAMRLVGARGFQADSELSRLYRDVLAGMFHPSSSRALAGTVRAVIEASA